MAKMNGFDPNASVDPATVTVKTPGSGGYAGAGTGTYVEVDVSKTGSDFLSVFLQSFGHQAYSFGTRGRGRRIDRPNLRMP